jgi:hypothetical protein
MFLNWNSSVHSTIAAIVPATAAPAAPIPTWVAAKHNTICVGNHYAQKNTNTVNKTWAIL